MRIRILGPLEVSENGRPLQVGGARLRALLILLALDTGRLVPAERLIADMWEDHPPTSAPNALQSLVSRLRALIGRDLIESRPTGYRLIVPRPDVDAHDFEARVLRARSNPDSFTRSAELHAALDLWRGPALADVSRFPFADSPVARLDGLRRSALEHRIEADLALGRHAELIPELQALAAADPLREPLCAHLMRALYASGRQAEALAVYQDTKRSLAEALGVDPSPDLENIYLSVLRQDPSIAPPQPTGPNASSPHGGTAPGDTAPGTKASRGAALGGAVPDGAAHSGATQSGATQSGAIHGGAGPGGAPRGAAAAALALVPDLPAEAVAVPVRVETPNNLRARLTSFIGRDEDLKRVGEVLEGSRLVTLTGPGGAGKTRLSLESGDRMLDRLADGVWFVELAPIGDPAEVPHAVLGALGLRETAIIAGRGRMAAVEVTDPLARLVAALGDKRMLILLDNCEHLLDAAARLADRLLADCPGVRILATSREPLGITGESLWPVEPLALPPLDALPDEAVTFPAVRLFADRGGAVRPGFTVADRNVAQIVRICRALDGMPLAIELAAARLRALTAEQIAERLDDRFRLLTGGSRTALPRHQTLRAVVEWSWELLDDAERALWRRLSVFAGSATVESAEAVCADIAVSDGGATGGGPATSEGALQRGGRRAGASRGSWELDVVDVFDTLSALVDKSLVLLRTPWSDVGGPRYLMLETIKAYGWERLTEAGEEDQLRRAHAEYFLRLAETAEPQLRGHDQIYWLGKLTAEHDNLHAALRWAISAGEATLAVRLCASLGWYWWLRGHWAEGSETAADVLSMSDLPHTQSTAVAAALSALTSMGGPRDFEEVKRWLRLARDITGSLDEELHPVLRLVSPLMDMAGHGMDFRNPRAAETLFTDPDPWVRSMGRFIHGQIAINIGQIGAIKDDLVMALAGFRSVGDRWGTSFVLTAQAEIHTWRGEHREAIDLYQEALRLVDELGVIEGAVWHISAKLANELALLGEQDKASKLLSDALRTAERQGSPETMAAIQHQFGEFARRSGDRDEALRRLDRAKDIVTVGSAGPPQFPAMIAASRGLLEAETGDLSAARKLHRDALEYAVQAMDNPIIALVLMGYADVAERKGDPERAAELLGSSDGLRGMRDQSIPDAARLESSLRTTLGDHEYTTAYERGRTTDLETVLTQFGLELPTRGHI